MINDHKKHLFDLLRNIQLFSSLTDEELHQIRDKMKIKRFKKNEIILYEDNTNEVMYAILYGKVKVIQTTEDGKEIIIAIHRAGEFFGEISLIDSRTVPAMVAAMEDSAIAIISREDFHSLIYTQGKVLNIFLKILCSRLRESWGRIQILSFNNASQRIKMLFMLLSQEYGIKTNEGTLLNIKLTHQDIADMAGVARETVTRVIDKLHKNREIKVLKNKIILLGHNFLKRDLKL